MGDAFTDAAKVSRREERLIEREIRHFLTLLAYLERPSEAAHGAAVKDFLSIGYDPDAPEVAAFSEELRGLVRGDRPLWAALLAAAFCNDVGRLYVGRLKACSPFAGMIVAAAKSKARHESGDFFRLYGERKEIVRELAGKRGSFTLETPHGTFVAVKPSPRRKRK